MSLGWLYDGVNTSIPRNAGPECAQFASTHVKVVEGIIVTIINIILMKWAISNLRPLPTVKVDKYNNNNNYGGKEFLLTAMSLTFGLELGFKFASRSVIYVLNPCHITTIIQIYLLAAKPSKTVTTLFRIQMNYLNGPFLAFLFPETDSRVMPMETATYWLQHGLLFIIPIYLLRTGGVYNMESITDITWNTIGVTGLLLYHFTILHIFSIPTQVNLNHMLCPALKDPFDGPYYRIAACIHQAILCPALCKFYCMAFIPSPKNSSTLTKISNSSSPATTDQVIFLANQLKENIKNGGDKLLEKLQNSNNIKLNGGEKAD